MAELETTQLGQYRTRPYRIGIEFGFLLVYRSGWNLGIAAVLTNVVASLILLPVAVLFFKDKICIENNVAGIFSAFPG